MIGNIGTQLLEAQTAFCCQRGVLARDNGNRSIPQEVSVVDAQLFCRNQHGQVATGQFALQLNHCFTNTTSCLHTKGAGPLLTGIAHLQVLVGNTQVLAGQHTL